MVGRETSVSDIAILKMQGDGCVESGYQRALIADQTGTNIDSYDDNR
jgi:hypothetical protein